LTVAPVIGGFAASVTATTVGAEAAVTVVVDEDPMSMRYGRIAASNTAA
jgi:hypothetical protein